MIYEDVFEIYDGWIMQLTELYFFLYRKEAEDDYITPILELKEIIKRCQKLAREKKLKNTGRENSN